MTSDAPLLTITGPTAVGKTALSLRLAQHLDAEILSVDSRQVYREMTIGTAKPTPEERRHVPHHFIDERSLLEPDDEPLSAGRFAEEANARIREIRRRGRRPLIVGGSTLYLHALQVGLADIPAVDEGVREELEARLTSEGAGTLYRELERVDPAAAESMDPTKTQRLVRALEVYHGTGKPLSKYHEEQPEPPFSYRTFVLHRPRPQLYDRINRRVDAMLVDGLLAEVRTLLDAGVDFQSAPLRTIGYQEPAAYLRGENAHEEMVRLIKRNSRRYAKRQLTWFRRYDEYEWLDVRSDDALPTLLAAGGEQASC